MVPLLAHNGGPLLPLMETRRIESPQMFLGGLFKKPNQFSLPELDGPGQWLGKRSAGTGPGPPQAGRVGPEGPLTARKRLSNTMSASHAPLILPPSLFWGYYRGMAIRWEIQDWGLPMGAF